MRPPRVVLGLLLAVAAASAAPVLAGGGGASLDIRGGGGLITVTTGAYRWVLSTTAFDVVHGGWVAGQQRLHPGRASVELRGAALAFGPPTETKSGPDWVELRGWVDRAKALWYVARYQFFAGQPYARLVLTLTDRHDTSPAAEPWAPYWNTRVLSKWRVEIGAPGGKPATIAQHNSYSAAPGGAPWVDVVSATGSPYQWTASVPPLDPARFQLVHGAKDGANQVVWHPMYEGRAELSALFTGYSGGAAYRAAKSVTYEVVDALGVAHARVVDQGAQNGVRLGTFALGKASRVRLRATGRGGEEVAVAGPLRVAPASGERPFEIRLGTRHDGVLTDGPLSLVVKDFWQHHPIALVRTEQTLGWEAIRAPELFAGGMGLTLEAMIAMDGDARAASAALYAPPRRELPAWVSRVDGSLAGGAAGARYDALLRSFPERMAADLERMDSFGWRNWGDYQIGASYVTAAAGPVEDWANLQYDLPYGLLLAWLRTGDPVLWRHAQASVRHLMDMDLVKFSPFPEKLNGLVYRKGETPRSRSHVAAEPIVDEGFAFRSLLLYHALTGEEWARDLARQNVERLAYYASTRPQFVLEGDRPTSWMLRGALAGAQHFAGDGRYNYMAVADGVARQLVGYYQSQRKLPGKQPVWQGQMVEGLIQYHQRTGRADVAEAIVGHARYFVTEALRRERDGTYQFLYCHTPAGKYCPVPQWSSETNYPFLWLATLAYAGRLSGDPALVRWADTLFAYGTTKLVDHQDIRTWTSALGFPHLYLELAPAR